MKVFILGSLLYVSLKGKAGVVTAGSDGLRGSQIFESQREAAEKLGLVGDDMLSSPVNHRELQAGSVTWFSTDTNPSFNSQGGATWSSARDFCSAQSMRLCSHVEICGAEGVPVGNPGIFPHHDQWVAVSSQTNDEPCKGNSWVQIGEWGGSSNSPGTTCSSHHSLTGSCPDWGTEATGTQAFQHFTACCPGTQVTWFNKDTSPSFDSEGGETWSSARNFCSAQSMRLCSQEELCFGAGSVQEGVPDLGITAGKDQWVAVSSEMGDSTCKGNSWVQIGEWLGSSDPPGTTCSGHNSLAGSCPAWGTEATGTQHFQHYAACCSGTQVTWSNKTTSPSYDSEGGVTWPDANEFCSAQFMRLCTQEEICSGGAGSVQEGIPVSGSTAGKDQWVAVSSTTDDDPCKANTWVQVGKWLGSSDPARTACSSHYSLAGSCPVWGKGLFGTQVFQEYTACCPTESVVSFKNKGNGKVWDILGGSTIFTLQNNQKVIAHGQKCTHNQEWVVNVLAINGSSSGDVIKSKADRSKCLTLESANCQAGAKIVVQDCVTQNPLQKWILAENGEVRLSQCNKNDSTKNLVVAEAADGSLILAGNENTPMMFWEAEREEDCPDEINQSFQSDFCWRETHTRGGASLPTQCPKDAWDKGLFCFDTGLDCPSGYYKWGFDCHQMCPQGFEDKGGMVCGRPGPSLKAIRPYGWELGDPAFSASGQFKRCEKDNGGPGSCFYDKHSFLVYPNCGPFYEYQGWGLCSHERTVCHAHGMSAVPLVDGSCYKKVISAFSLRTCTEAQGEESLYLCYKDKCQPGYEGAGPVCWAPPPKDWVPCGMGAAKDLDTCKNMLEAQTGSVANVAMNIVELALVIVSGGSSAPSKVFKELLLRFNKLREVSSFVQDRIEFAKLNMNERSEGGESAWIDLFTASVDMKPADMVRVAAQIISVLDPTGISDVVAAYSYPMCAEIK